jgi:hypothetical protein
LKVFAHACVLQQPTILQDQPALKQMVGTKKARLSARTAR